MDKKSPIGVFDSGLGGISVLHTIKTNMPNEDLLYFGDSKYNPYGTKTKEEITNRCIEICDHLIERGCKAIVIACNTATSACVPLLRKKYDIDIIGMEPALKVACSLGEKQRIAVWATDFTLKEEKFAKLMHRFEDEHEIIKVPCPKLVELVEQDQLQDTNKVDSALQEYLALSQGVDSIVLGCTHFVFYKDALQNLCKEVHLVDGNLGTTMHLKDVLCQKDLLSTNTSGSLCIENTLAEKEDLSYKLLKVLEEKR